jgi:hypothetical protein
LSSKGPTIVVESDAQVRTAHRRALTLRQGAQERSVPVKNGCSPDAPDAGHSSHAGAALEGAVVAVAEDPPEVAREDDVDPVVPSELDRAADAPPVDAVVELAVVEPAVVEPAVVEPPVVVVAGAG